MKKITLSLLACCCALATQTFAQDKQQMRLGTAVQENSHYGVAAIAFAKEVAERTQGRIEVMNFHAGALGAERETMEAVQLGTLELTLISSGPVPNFVPETRILDVPFLFRDYPHARGVLDGPIGQELLQKFEAKGMKALGWCDNGFRHMTNNRRPVNVPDDLKGLKLRTMENPVHITAYKAFGIIPTPMAFTELFTALQQGTVDGQENPLSVIRASKFDQVQKHLSLTGHVFSPCVLAMNKAVWSKLSADDQKAFEEAAKIAIAANRARVDKDEQEAVAHFRANGMEVIETVDKAPFEAALEKVNAEFSRQFGADKMQAIRDWKP